MPGIHAQLLTYFQLNQQLIDQQTREISHSQSLLQLPFRGNCMNWVLGHILTDRDEIFHLAGYPCFLSDAQHQLYQTGSEPILFGGNAMMLSDLLDLLARSTEQLTRMVESESDEWFRRIHESPRGSSSFIEEVMGYMWHETYHVGQLEYLRQLAGKNDQVV